MTLAVGKRTHLKRGNVIYNLDKIDNFGFTDTDTEETECVTNKSIAM